MEKTYPENVTKNEARLLAVIRSLHPYEKVTVSADKSGIVDNYIVERSYREVWTVIAD
jgi:hypothetical protein